MIWTLRQKEPSPSAANLPSLSPTSTPQSPSPGREPAPQPNLPPYRGEAIEALNADPKFLAQVPEATRQQSRQELAGLAVGLDKNPSDYGAWMMVAYIKHFYGDDRGARDAYEYMNLVLNEYPLPFYNLALIYGYYLKEPAKAVPKFASAIKLNPVESSYYIGLADFYREVLGDLNSAEATLVEGANKIKGNVNIFTSLASLHKAMGNIAKSIEYYELALASPGLGGAEREAIRAEVERLKQALQL